MRLRLARARVLVSAAALILAIVAAEGVLRGGPPHWQPERLRSWVAQAGVLAPLLFMVVVALRHLLLIPSWVAHVAGGLLFGAVAGTFLGTIGTALGAVLAFGMSRILSREVVVRSPAPAVDRAARFMERDGHRWLAVLTALPFTPLTPIYCTAGLSEMRFALFLTAAVVGLLPRVGLFSLLGALSVEPPPLRRLGAPLLVLLGVVLLIALRRRSSERARRPRKRSWLRTHDHPRAQSLRPAPRDLVAYGSTNRYRPVSRSKASGSNGE